MSKFFRGKALGARSKEGFSPTFSLQSREQQVVERVDLRACQTVSRRFGATHAFAWERKTASGDARRPRPLELLNVVGAGSRG
jgi:hypothetical protein